MNLQRYSKFIVALSAAAAVLVAALNDNVTPGFLTSSEGIQVILAFLGAMGVYAVPNKE